MIDASGPELIESKLRVMTWNVWWQYGPWEKRLGAIAATLERVGADIIALQEVWEAGERCLAAELARPLGFDHAYRARKVEDGVRFGNALLSRWPIRRVETRELPGVAGRDELRLAIGVECEGPRGPIHAFSTHLNWRAHDSLIRQQQVRELARFVADMGPTDFVPVVCGDFNALASADEMRMLTGESEPAVPGQCFLDAWRCAGDGGSGYTWDNVNPFARRELGPEGRIDFILAGWPRARGAGHIVRCEVCGNTPIGGVWPSDHFAVMAELRY